MGFAVGHVFSHLMADAAEHESGQRDQHQQWIQQMAGPNRHPLDRNGFFGDHAGSEGP